MTNIIIGAGPTGLSLAYTLVKNKQNVILIEQSNILGGSWNSYWIENKYFSENSPRVLSNNGIHIDFLKEIGLQNDDFSLIYGNFFQTSIQLLNFIYEYFTIVDYFVFMKALIQYRTTNYFMTVQEWMDISYLSNKAKYALRILCITICDLPKNTNITDFVSSINPSGMDVVQMKEPNKWHQLIEFYFRTQQGIQVYKNMKVIQVNGNSHSVTSVDCLDIFQNRMIQFSGDKIFLCTQSSGIYSIIKNSNEFIQNNWGTYEQLRDWSLQTFYSGFGFQYHFKEKIKFPKNWCWSCKTEWTIIILPVGEWLTTKSKDRKVKSVWSCCIIDMETPSSRLGKTPNECSKQEIMDECLYQLRTVYPSLPCPYKMTISPGLRKDPDQNKWISQNTGFSRNTYGYLPMKGRLTNLFALGCFTKNLNYSISYIKTAVEATKLYLDTYEPDLKGFHKKPMNYKLYFVIFTILIIVVSLSFYYYLNR